MNPKIIIGVIFMAIAMITLIVLILINGFFAASELAFVNLNDNKIKRMADKGDKKSVQLYNLIEHPSLFLSTIQIGITLAGFLSSAFAADFFAGPISEQLYEWGVPLPLGTLNTLSVIVVTVLLSYFTLVFGELVPKQLALGNAEKIANAAVGPVSLLAKISAPVVKFLSLSINLVLKTLGVDPNQTNEEATEENIRLMVDLGKERGNIKPYEEWMINNIFEFNDTTVMNIITHRTDMSVFPLDANFDDILKEINNTRYTRYPVYDGDIDNIVGILHVKDLFMFIASKKTFNLKKIIREPLYVLDSQTIDKVFTNLQKENTHLAIVHDEFGGTQGLITIEDVIEEVLGDINSESREPELNRVNIKKISKNRFRVNGTTRLRDLEEALEMTLPSDQYETIRGFLIGQIGHVPRKDEKHRIKYENLTIDMKANKDNRMDKITITKHDAEDD